MGRNGGSFTKQKIKTTSAGATVTGDLQLLSTDSGAGDNPSLDLYRNSSSPAVNDLMGEIIFSGEDAGGNKTSYAKIESVITDTTDGSEDGILRLRATINGSMTTYYNAGYGANFFYKKVALHTGVDLAFEGSTNDNFETTLTVTDPTADRTITLPNATGDVVLNESGIVNITSTANEGPVLNLISNDPADASDFDVEAKILFKAENSASEETSFAIIKMTTADITDGTEDGRIRFNLQQGGNGLVDSYQFSSSVLFLENDAHTIRWNNTRGTTHEVNLQTATPTATRTITLPDLTGTVALTSQLSDIRDKKDVEDLQLGLDFVNAMRPVQFTWDRRDGSYNDVKELGFIAQELDQVERQFDTKERTKLVTEMSEDELHVSPMNSYPILVKAIQELSAQVESLQARVKELEG